MDKIIKDIKKKLESYVLPDGIEVIPSYASLKSSKEEFATKYSGVVMNYSRICKSLSDLQYMSVTIDRLLRELPNSSNEVFSKQKLLSTELKNAKDETLGLIASYKYFKDGLESVVKFYQNMNFVLTSYTMGEV